MEFAKQKAVWQILRCSILRRIWMLCGNFRPKARQVVCRRGENFKLIQNQRSDAAGGVSIKTLKRGAAVKF